MKNHMFAVLMFLRPDRQTDMAKIFGAFLQIFFGNASNEYIRKELKNNNPLSRRTEEYRDTLIINHDNKLNARKICSVV